MIVFAHGREYWCDMRRTDRQILRHSAVVLTNSHFTLRKMRGVLPEVQAQACPLGLPAQVSLREMVVDTAEEPLELQSCDGNHQRLGNRVLLLVGRVDAKEREKGHYALLEAMPYLRAKFPDLQLVLAGSGDDLKTLSRAVMEKGVGSAVFVPGYVSREVLQRLYETCYAFVMPSRQEGFGLVYLEAMNYGKPCVGCFDDGAEEVIVHGQTGLLIRDPNNTNELVTTLRTLLDDPKLAAEMGRRGFERLHRFYTPAHFRTRLSTHLARLLCQEVP